MPSSSVSALALDVLGLEPGLAAWVLKRDQGYVGRLWERVGRWMAEGQLVAGPNGLALYDQPEWLSFTQEPQVDGEGRRLALAVLAQGAQKVKPDPAAHSSCPTRLVRTH